AGPGSGCCLCPLRTSDRLLSGAGSCSWLMPGATLPDAGTPTPSSTVRDAFQRPLRNLRLSVTDRCNLRCAYCMPEKEYVWLPRTDILRFEEIALVVDAFTAAGVDKVRITGGEPLVRHDLDRLLRVLADQPAIRD